MLFKHFEPSFFDGKCSGLFACNNCFSHNKNNYSKKVFRAFSIIELMISLVIISLVVAAFTPVITKKMQNKTASGSAVPGEMDDETIAELKAKTADMFLPFDAVAGKTQTTADGGYFKCNSASSSATSVTCKVKIPSDHVSIVMVGAGGGGTNGPSEKRNYYGGGCGRNLTIQDKVVNIEKYTAAEGGSTDDMYRIDPGAEIEYIKECPKGSVQITTGSGSEFCVTQYNLRPSTYDEYHYNFADTRSKVEQSLVAATMAKELPVKLSNDSFVTDSGTNAEYTYIYNNKKLACWFAPSPYCKGEPGGYPSCYRTTCNWLAAKTMCNDFALGENNCSDDGIIFDKPCKGRWRLLGREEIFSLGTLSTSNSSFIFGDTSYLHTIIPHNFVPVFLKNENVLDAFNRCYYNHNYNKENYCQGYSNCEGTTDNYCEPSQFWATSISDEKAYLVPIGYYGYSYSSYGAEKGKAYSVRCVMPKLKARPLHTYIQGARGASGIKITNLKVPSKILDECEQTNSCKLVISGSNAPASKLHNYFPNVAIGEVEKGIDLDPTEIYVKDDNKIYWGYKIEGAKGGGATSEVINNATSELKPGKGGKAARYCYTYDTSISDWSEPFECISTNNEISSHIELGTDGQDGEILYNKEKVPGDILRTSTVTHDFTANPFPQKITVSGYTPASASCYVTRQEVGFMYGGTGGGGGAFAHILDIPIIPNKEYEITIGKGGTISTYYGYNAGSGGDTVIKLDNNTVLTAGGGKGGKTRSYYGSGEIGKAGIFSTTTESDVIKSILKDKSKTFSANGTDGAIGTYNASYFAPGGNGGLSGISVFTKIVKNSVMCGGLFKDDSNGHYGGCVNENDVNAMTPSYISSLHAPVKHIYLDGNYGSYGAGGAGGGQKYEENSMMGAGSAGQNGYIYFYWNK